jgi:hypothetical protein
VGPTAAAIANPGNVAGAFSCQKKGGRLYRVECTAGPNVGLPRREYLLKRGFLSYRKIKDVKRYTRCREPKLVAASSRSNVERMVA